MAYLSESSIKKCQLQKKSPDSLHLSFCHIIISLLCWRQSK
ncbi:hypothetical protein HMPREF9436_00891 [Faecalibacterium cf. prausnitzii KLE1255]|uniref:Uncharacterized protein n=1 Tax=Faecalibacterium cf. prausnitzii KLE1255 TaxID=748224 RepID=E2ZGV4_9FIRM|nr:hypothetical protein HMPREF9436_00891 [Faecalibacterium cf. prausnitzii KLE1255]